MTPLLPFLKRIGWFCSPFLYFVYLAIASASVGQHLFVTAQVEIIKSAKEEKSASAVHLSSSEANVVVWLQPIGDAAKFSSVSQKTNRRAQLIQRNKSFEPHVLVVEVGSVVDFPNHDPFFHNVFSLFDGKRFDLGLYEAGATNSVRFDKVGVSFLFCNIHPEMSAVVVVVDTPYFGISDKSGHMSIMDVPDGRYEMHVWYEKSLAEDLKQLTRMVSISTFDHTLGVIHVPENADFTPAHKNKYGQDYVPPPTTTYSNP